MSDPSTMSLREKIGQMIMTGFPSSNISEELQELIEDYKISNIILFSHNIKTIHQIRSLCFKLHEIIEKNTNNPAFIAIDQEGGVVTRLPEEASNVSGAMLIGATGNSEYAYKAGLITGTELKALGVNLDLAPVLDVNSNPNNPVIGVRSYSGDPHIVEEFGIKMQKGLMDAGVMSTAKHFPGHGDTAVDSHLGLPVIDKDITQLLEEELIPFQSAIQEGIPCIMSSHILFPRLDSNKIPATMSKTILTGLLRDKLGFEGIIITDCLEMAAIQTYYGVAKGAVEAVKAGAQILCISHTPSKVKDAISKIEEAVESGEIPIKLIDDAVVNILKYKMEYRLDLSKDTIDKVGCKEHKNEIKEMALAGITKVSKGELSEITKDTLYIGSYAYKSTLVSSDVNMELHFAKYMARKMQGSYLEVSLNPDEEEIHKILKLGKSAPLIIYGLYNGHLNLGQIELANRMCQAGYKVIAVTLRNPYDLELLDERIQKIALYEYNTFVFDALGKVLNKEV